MLAFEKRKRDPCRMPKKAMWVNVRMWAGSAIQMKGVSESQAEGGRDDSFSARCRDEDPAGTQSPQHIKKQGEGTR